MYNDLIGRLMGFILRADVTREDLTMLMECADAIYEMQERLKGENKTDGLQGIHD